MTTSYSPFAVIVLAGTTLIGALSVFAFHPGYFAIDKRTLPWYVHAHTALMILWMGLQVMQAYAILKKNYRQHRAIGKGSYVVMPVLIVLAAVMMQYGFDRAISSYDSTSITKAQINETLASMALPFYYFAGLVLFYPLAIVYMKKPFMHGQYMIAAMLMLTGPVFDRILYIYCPNTGILWEGVAFATMDLVFLWILGYSLRHNLSYAPALIALSFFGIGQAGYFFGRESEAWLSFADFLFR